MDINYLRELYNSGSIKWSVHCLERMQERDITIDDIGCCINNGEIIEEYPNDYPHPSCLILGININGNYLHVVAGSDGKILFIISAYYPSLQKFEADYRTRRS